MHKGCREVLFAILLGLVIPSLIFAYFDKRVPVNPSDEYKIATSNYQTIEDDDICISVLKDNGNTVMMKLNDYLVSVLLREMPADFEVEALKAQAVVARTYTLRRHLSSNSKHEVASVCTDSGCCQGYYEIDDYLHDGGSLENVQKMKDAVAATDGEVLMYDNKLIEATYFSCSGGMTEDAAAVWGEEIPYLNATSSPGEEHATHHTDTITFTTSEFAEKLGITPPTKAQQWVQNVTYTSGGGVEEIQICDKVFTGTSVRQKLGLYSTAFVISIVGDTVTITTKGFGHRVGMSQYGADAMAVQGSNYQQILAHYYQGTSLVVFDGN